MNRTCFNNYKTIYFDEFDMKFFYILPLSIRMLSILVLKSIHRCLKMLVTIDGLGTERVLSWFDLMHEWSLWDN